MPGMIDTHRHMWQTAMRGYGADWTLTQYFVWYYLEHGKQFRPEDVHAGNLLAAWDALEAGVTTTVDWSHGLQTVDHAEAAVDALQSVPGRFVLAYGNIQAGPWEWTADPAVRSFLERRPRTTCYGCAARLRRHRRPGVPRAARLRGGPRARPAGHDARRRLGRDQRRRHPADARERLHDAEYNVYVHAATLSTDSYHRIAATGGSVSVSTESEQSAGQGYPPTWQLRQHGIPVSLSMDTSVWWSSDLFSAMRTTLGADRSREHLEAHAAGDTVTNVHLRAEQVVEWATRGGATALGRDDDRQARARREGRRRADEERRSPVSFPLLNPYGHVAFQAQRGDVHTVLVDGRVVKHEGELVGVDLADLRRQVDATVEHLRRRDGRGGLGGGHEPGTAGGDDKVLDNPYQYTEFRTDTTRARGTVFGEPGAGEDG